MPKEVERMPAPERAQRYRRYAAETLRLANATHASEIRATYLSLSACWSSLANEAERVGDLDVNLDDLEQHGDDTPIAS